jgi:hypothetical protein
MHMSSLESYTAADRERKYDNCFLKWYSESMLHYSALVDFS